MVLHGGTRRDFLQLLGLATGAGLLGCQPYGGNGGGGGENGTEPTPDPGPGTGTGVVVRGDVTGSGADMLDAYRAAVDAMKLLADSDPRSWVAQAEIHDNHCPHGNAFFLPWHRAYLRYFEEVCRAMSGDDGFALPYWNWTTHPTIPAPFWQGTLNDPTRVVGPSDPMPPSAVGQPVIDSILQIADFQTFASAYVPSSCTTNCQRWPAGTGALEGTPHNVVHGTIGGNMGTYMSPLDPIFWLHHCNVDRLWVEWNKTFANPEDNAFWLNFDFADNFVDGDGNPVPSVVVHNLFDTFALGYRYDTQPEVTTEAVEPEPPISRVAASIEIENSERAEMGEPLRIPVYLSAEIRERLERPGLESEGGDTTVRLSLVDVPTPEDPVLVHLYVGGESAPGSTDDPRFVRSFGFFPAVAADDPHDHAKTFLFDVGARLADLGAGSTLPIYVETQPLRPGVEAAGRGVAPVAVRIEVVERSS